MSLSAWREGPLGGRAAAPALIQAGGFAILCHVTVPRSRIELPPASLQHLFAKAGLRNRQRSKVSLPADTLFRLQDLYAEIGTVEVRTPETSLGRWIGHGGWHDQWQLFAFWDGGEAWDHTLLAGEPGETAPSSAGLGLKASIGTCLTGRVDWGYRLSAAGDDSLHGSLVDAGVTLGF